MRTADNNSGRFTGSQTLPGEAAEIQTSEPSSSQLISVESDLKVCAGIGPAKFAMAVFKT